MPSDTVTRKFAEAAIDALAVQEELLSSSRDGVRLTFSELYAYVHSPSTVDDEEFWNRLQKDPIARTNLNALLERTALYHLPTHAAASSEETRLRETRQFKAALIPSRAEPSQVYLAIEIVDRGGATPQYMFLRTAEGILRLKLPEFVSGRGQLLLDTADPVTIAFQDPATEIFLR